MGSLAFWGGVAGAGKGMVANAAVQAESQAKDLEYAREQTLRKLEHEYAGSREAQRQAFEKEQGDTQFRQEAVLAAQRGGIQAEDTAKRIESTEREGAKERANRLKVAEIGAAADVEKASRRGRGRSRWQFDKLNQGAQFDKNGRLISEGKQFPIVQDKVTGKIYRQEGGRFYLTDAEGNMPPPKLTKDKNGRTVQLVPPRAAVARLLQNPDQISDFVNDYGFIPGEYFSVLGSGTSDENNKED